MHISDLHAGPPFNPALAEQVAREAHELEPDLLVASGDFVQRADFVAQWRTIAAFLRTLPEPRLVVPGGNTAHGLTIDGGHLNGEQIATLERIFTCYPASTCKVAVLHHHVVNPPGSLDRRKIS